MRRLFIPIMALLLAACGSSSDEPASGAPDAADVAAADAQSASSGTLHPHASTKDVQSANDMENESVGFGGYGALRFGMSRAAAEQAIGDRFAGPEQEGVCEELVRADEPDITYLFLNGSLQRIDVQSPDAVADGGGHVGMEIDDIRSLYGGRLSESASKVIPGGLKLTVAGPRGNGIVFRTDGNSKVVAFHAAVAAALDRADGCTP